VAAVADSEAAAAEVGAVNWARIVRVLNGYPAPVPATEVFDPLAEMLGMREKVIHCPVPGCPRGAFGPEGRDSADYRNAIKSHLRVDHQMTPSSEDPAWVEMWAAERK
jgi:hypothetical protein